MIREKDTYKTKGLRKKLVEELIQKGITSTNVLQAISNVKRHLFLDQAFEEWAYKDIAFPIEADQTISQPYTVAIQTTLLDILQNDKILEIGTGSGYQAAILSHLGAKVYTIERQELLFKKTSKLLNDLGYGLIRTLYGDGWEGAPRFAPFDKIIITAAAEKIPQKLIEQLAIGGSMVLPVGTNVQKMLLIKKISEDKISKKEYGNFRFVPMLKGTNQITK